MNNKPYQIIFFKKNNGQKPVHKYIEKLPEKERAKVLDYINKLSHYPEFRQEPYSRQIKNKLRELKVDFRKNRYRIIYFFNIGKIIILLHAFQKKTAKTPKKEIKIAKQFMQDYINQINL